jgi:type VI secretion system VasD/TssJ family lipoprotein
MKRQLQMLFIIFAIFSVCSCASKPEVRPVEPSPPPPVGASPAEAASYRADLAAKKAEDSAGEARQAAERAERAGKQFEELATRARQAAERAERAAKRCEDLAAQARQTGEGAERAAKRCEDSSAQVRDTAERATRQCEDSSKEAREAADRAEKAARRIEALMAVKPAPPPEKPLPPKPPEKPAEKPPEKPPEAPAARTQEAEWRYEKDGIRLHLKSDPQLNLYQRSPHTLVLCVYHLKDPNAFNQLVDEKEGLWKLLECGRFDPSVTNSKRVVIQPGQEMTELLDRPEGARYVGLVAGYYLLQKERVVRLFPIPVASERRGSTIFLKPGMLNIDLFMGPQEIQDLR